jgi:trimethylamine--corrinoid protein Co-methyltransferase
MRPHVRVLDDVLRDRILEEALRLLGEIGIDVQGERLRRRLLDAGLPLDASGRRVLFTRDVVDRALAAAPRSFVLYDRAGRPHADLGGDRVHFVPGSSGLKILDHRTGEVRLANTADFVDYVRVADGLTHVAYLATAFSTNDDIEAQVSDAWRLRLCLTHSLRPVVSGAFTAHGVGRMAEMLHLFRAGRDDFAARPCAIFTVTASGNFRYGHDSCENLVDCVEAGIPVEIVPVTLMGLVAPVTLAGATVFHVVDVLAGIVMAQVLRPGTPVLFGGAPATFHMQRSSSPMAAVEALQLDVAYVQVAKALGLPTQAYMALSDAKVIDAQAGAETFAGALLAAAAGVNSVSGPGMLDYVVTFSLAKLVLDDDLCGQALHFVRETGVKDDLPTGDLVRHLLDDQHLIIADHTLEHWPRELYLPGAVIDRDNREAWTSAGALDTNARACAAVDERLSACEPVATDPALVRELDRIVKSGLRAQERLPEVAGN